MTEPPNDPLSLILAGVAALMGAAGVALAAAGVHASGGELAAPAPCSSSSRRRGARDRRPRADRGGAAR